MKTKDTGDNPVVVLVHGAFADGSSWRHVIPLLEQDGYGVIAVQNPLTSFGDDVATTKRVIDAQKGSVVAVGHSYGGAVITGAAADNPHVKALVYVAAFAPDAREKIGELLDKYGPSAFSAALAPPDAAGFLYIDRAKFYDVVAKDVSLAETRVMAATQKPIAGAAFGGAVDTPALKTHPSWDLVAQEEHGIKPDTQRLLSKRVDGH